MERKFEGAIENVIEPHFKFIREVIERRGCNLVEAKVTFLVLGEAGDNYSANVKRIIVQSVNDELRMVAKFAPTPDILRVTTQTEHIFRNEHIIYTQILPKFQELEENADVPKADRLMFPECYGTYMDAPNELILLEDLQVLGFNMMDKFKPLPDVNVKSVLKNIAILHSLSYTLRYKELNTFKAFADSLHDTWDNTDDVITGELKKFVYDIEDKSVATVYGDDRKRLLNGCVSKALALMVKMKKEISSSKQSVILQGDAWTNNILFKFDGDNLQQSVMIDYQLSRLGNPTCDIMYLIFNCTTHEDRLQHFNDWIDYYHSELDKSLHNHGLETNDVYPRDQLDADMKRFAKIMFGVCVMTANITLLKPEEAMKMREAFETHNFNEVHEMNSYNQEYTSILKERIEGVVDSFLKFGLLI